MVALAPLQSVLGPQEAYNQLTVTLQLRTLVFRYKYLDFFQLMHYLEIVNDICLFFSGLVDETD